MKAKDLLTGIMYGGGGSAPSGTLDITENGEYDVSEYASADVDVQPDTGAKTITQNGSYLAESDNLDGYDEVVVAVPNTYTAGDEGKVVSSGALVSQTSKNISTNGTHDTTTNNEVVVDVPNSYAAGDEGKVVQSGALVSQSSQNIDQNGTYDTTTKNEVVVNVSSGELQENEVNFYDFDGTLLYAMTIAQANALTALPALPDHSQDEIPLINATWNYTLAELQTLQIPLNVGATYNISDNYNHIIVELPEDELTVYVFTNNASSPAIDFGDGTTASGNSFHTYSTPGKKHIKIAVGYNSTATSVRVYKTGRSDTPDTTSSGADYGNRTAIKELYIRWLPGANYNALLEYAFGLEKVLISRSVTSIPYTFLTDCHIPFVAIPRECTNTGIFASSGIIETISIPPTITSYFRFNGKRVSFRVNNSGLTISAPSSVIVTEEIYIQNDASVNLGILGNISGYFSLRKVVVTGSATIPSGSAFGHCPLLESIELRNITALNGSILYYSKGPLKLKLGGSFTSVPYGCFNYCGADKIDLPSTVTSIADAFSNSAVQILICRATTPPTLSKALPAYTHVYVPDAAVSDYEAATNWASSPIHALSDIEP